MRGSWLGLYPWVDTGSSSNNAVSGNAVLPDNLNSFTGVSVANLTQRLRHQYPFWSAPTNYDSNFDTSATPSYARSLSCGLDPRPTTVSNDLFTTYDSIILAANSLDKWVGHLDESTTSSSTSSAVTSFPTTYFHGSLPTQKSYIDFVRSHLTASSFSFQGLSGAAKTEFKRDTGGTRTAAGQYHAVLLWSKNPDASSVGEWLAQGGTAGGSTNTFMHFNKTHMMGYTEVI